jgi:IclR family acetate operon transcriptional repressor
MAARIGARDLVHSTALGKAILAFLPDEQREPFLTHPLAARTGQTITSTQRLRVELDTIRTEGVARETGENEPDARCVGAPVFDRNGICAALSISGPASRMDDASLERASAVILLEAAALSAELGGAWPISAELSRRRT